MTMQFCFSEMISRLISSRLATKCILTNVELTSKWKDKLQTAKQVIPRFHSCSLIIFSYFKPMIFYFSLPCTCRHFWNSLINSESWWYFKLSTHHQFGALKIVVLPGSKEVISLLWEYLERGTDISQNKVLRSQYFFPGSSDLKRLTHAFGQFIAIDWQLYP